MSSIRRASVTDICSLHCRLICENTLSKSAISIIIYVTRTFKFHCNYTYMCQVFLQQINGKLVKINKSDLTPLEVFPLIEMGLLI